MRNMQALGMHQSSAVMSRTQVVAQSKGINKVGSLGRKPRRILLPKLAAERWGSADVTQCLVLQFTCVGGKELKVSYPCVVLNVMVAEHNTNDQYQTLVRISHEKAITSLTAPMDRLLHIEISEQASAHVNSSQS